MKKFINDIKKYRRYILYATKAELNAEVANSVSRSFMVGLQSFILHAHLHFHFSGSF